MLLDHDTLQVEDVEWFEDENNGRIEFEPCLLQHEDYLPLLIRSPSWTNKLRIYDDQRRQICKDHV